MNTNKKTPTPATDRIIQSFLRSANEYQHKADAATGQVREGYLDAREAQLELFRKRMRAYGIETVPPNILERMLRSAG